MRPRQLGDLFQIDGATLGMQIEKTLRQLGHLGDAAGDGEARHRVAAQIFEHAPDEVAHVDQCHVGQIIERAHGGVGVGAGGGGDVRKSGGARHVDALMDRGDPGRARIRHHDAGGAEDRQAADDAEPRVERLRRKPLAVDELVAAGRKLVAGRAGIMVKLEKPSAIQRLGEIIELADGLMVARGDLGVEMPPEDVPSVQKQVIHASRAAGKPVVVATQMLESMIAAPTPTRAEASDVATAVYEGADAVMLSAETAAGRYPIEAAAIMNRIACRVEDDPLYRSLLQGTRVELEHTAPDAISAAACQVAAMVGAAAIVSYTTSGATALRAARERPDVPVLVLTSKIGTARRLAVLWGAHCVHTSDVKNFTDMVQKAARIAHQEAIAEPGQRIVVTAGVPFGTPGATNILRIAWVDR